MIDNREYRALRLASMILSRGSMPAWMPWLPGDGTTPATQSGQQPAAVLPAQEMGWYANALREHAATIRAAGFSADDWQEARGWFTFVAFYAFRRRVEAGDAGVEDFEELIRRTYAAHALALAHQLTRIERLSDAVLLPLNSGPVLPVGLSLTVFVDLPRDTPELGAEIVAMQHLGEALVNDPATQAVWDGAVDPLWQIGADFEIPSDTSYVLPSLLRTQDRAAAFLAAVPAALAATGDAIHPVDMLLWVGMHRVVLPGDSGALSPALTRVMNVCRLASLVAGVPAPGQAPGADLPTPPTPRPRVIRPNVTVTDGSEDAPGGGSRGSGSRGGTGDAAPALQWGLILAGAAILYALTRDD